MLPILPGDPIGNLEGRADFVSALAHTVKMEMLRMPASDRTISDGNPFSALSRYEMNHLISHLWHLRRASTVYALLSAENRSNHNAWFEAQEKIGDASGYLTDLTLALRLAEEFATQEIGASANGRKRQSFSEHVGQQVRWALALTGINSMMLNIPVPLLQALIAHRIWTPFQALSYARQNPDVTSRTGLLMLLLDHLPPDLRYQVYAEAWDASTAISDPVIKISMMYALAGKGAPEELASRLDKCLTAVANIKIDWSRAKALVIMVPTIPTPLLSATLELVNTVDTSGARLLALSAIAARNQEDLLPALLVSALGVRDLICRVKALRAIAAYA